MPTFAAWNGGLNVLTITFSSSLVNQPTALANWVLNLIPSGSVGPTIAAVVVPNQVQLTFAGTPGDEAESVEYLATPPDVVGTNLAPVAAFELFFS
ncbi:MAG: hypothetical protein L0219_14230 [Phycisphaerales bacterium]|nr:hypothetical protein [Phycisphaerales bacterium]MCI0676445.1 hypothetical protein [Phycisphaerales bacterium]